MKTIALRSIENERDAPLDAASTLNPDTREFYEKASIWFERFTEKT
jgi:hypothetical protein